MEKGTLGTPRLQLVPCHLLQHLVQHSGKYLSSSMFWPMSHIPEGAPSQFPPASQYPHIRKPRGRELQKLEGRAFNIHHCHDSHSRGRKVFWLMVSFGCSVQMLATPFTPNVLQGEASLEDDEKQKGCSCYTSELTWCSAQKQQLPSPDKRRGNSGSWRTWPGHKQTLRKEKASISLQSMDRPSQSWCSCPALPSTTWWQQAAQTSPSKSFLREELLELVATSPPIFSPPVLACVPMRPPCATQLFLEENRAPTGFDSLAGIFCTITSEGCQPSHTLLCRNAKSPCKVALLCPMTLTFNRGHNHHLKVLCPLQVPGTVDIPCEMQSVQQI